MSEWKEYRLADIATLIGDGLHGTPIFDDFGTYYFVNGNNLYQGHIVIKPDTKLVNKEQYELYKKPLSNRTILLSINGTIGNIAKYAGEKCILGKSACFINVTNEVDRDFVYYILCSPKFLFDITNNANGSTIKNVSLKQIREYQIKLPTLVEQQKIAGILLALDEKIETNRKINARLEELAQTIFKSWFIDFEPFGGKMPEDWNYKTIADFPHDIETGKRPKGGVSGITDGIPSIGAESIKGIGFYDYSKTKYIPVEYAETLKKGRIQDFDLLIYKDGGKPGYFIPDFSMMGLGFPFDEMFLNEHVFRLNLGKPELNIFAYFFFKTDEVMKYLNSVGGKAAIPGINQKNVEDIEILDLSIPLVLKFGSIVLPMFKTILENCKESARLAELRDTLLPKLMSGEIKLS